MPPALNAPTALIIAAQWADALIALRKESTHMHGERNLGKLLRDMNPVLHPGTFAFCCFADSRLPLELTPVGTFCEEEGLTAIVPIEQAQALGIDYQFESRKVTLTVHSALDAVGFLARVTAALAEGNIPCNVVSAYCHDHLFVPASRLGDALQILEDLGRLGGENDATCG